MKHRQFITLLGGAAGKRSSAVGRGTVTLGIPVNSSGRRGHS